MRGIRRVAVGRESRCSLIVVGRRVRASVHFIVLTLRVLSCPQDRGEPVALAEGPSDLIAFPTRKFASWIPWSLAACFAVVCGLVIQNNLSLRQDLASALAESGIETFEVASLGSMMATAPRAKAVAVWDGAHQEGILTLSSLPPLEPDKDYQLWIIDPHYQNPVNGGVFSVSARGETRFQFRPDQPVSTISAFAVSLERKGGVPKAEGPMVLLSNI